MVKVALQSTRPISLRASRSNAGGPLAFGIFTLAGALLLWVLYFHPLAQSREAVQSWRPVPCTVVSSRVVTHRGSKSTTYRPQIVYRFLVNGQSYQSSRYSFFSNSSSSYNAQLAIVRRYPPGFQTSCYVDPLHPNQAVLQPRDQPHLLLVILPGLFLLIGVIGLLFTTLKGLAGAGGGVSGGQTRGAFAPADANRSLTLRPRTGAIGKVGGIVIFALFWNGIVSVFVWQMANDWRRGRASIGLTLFLIPFVLIGIATLLLVVYQLLAMLNPRITLTLSRGAIEVGGGADAQWSFAGRYDRIEHLNVRLEGREEATYRRGTDTRTDRRVFASVDVFDTSRNFEIQSGRQKLHIPAGAPPTFHATSNKIVWLLKVHGQIPRWPDVKEEFEIEVIPSRNAAPAPLAAGAAPPDLGDPALSIEIEGGRTAFAPAETLRGTASWELDAAPKSLELRLFWYTRGKGTTDVGVIAFVPIESPQPRGSRAFEFHLPDRPPSFSGQLISVIWGIELIAHPGNRSQRKEIVVAPGGQEIRLDLPIATTAGS